MIFYIGKRFSAVQTGRRTVSVKCDKCQTDYFYDLVRQGTGTASAPYYIAQKAAQNRASAAASKDLKKRLSQDAELVPCPACNWINDELVNGYRKMRVRWVKVWIVVTSLGVAIISFVVLSAGQRNFENQWPYDIAWSVGLTGTCVTAGYGLRALLWNRIRPNAKFPGAPSLPAGTPRGWTQADLQAAPTPADGRYVAPTEHSEPFPGWATFRAGQLAFPNACCECMAPATTKYSQWLAVNGKDILKPPLCNECASRLRWSWFLYATAAVAGAVLLAFLLSMAFQIGRKIGLPLPSHWE